MKIAYLVLAHQHPHLLARLVRRLLDADGIVVIHFDANCGDAPVEELQRLLGADFGRLVMVDRVAVVWGEWSLVEATLNGLRAIAALDQQPDYVYLLSGSDYPVRPLDELAGFLERNRGREYIESFDDKKHLWVKKGIQTERYLYHFPFNWSRHPRLFALALRLQKLLRLKRRIPSGIDPHFGSQWWVLTWTSCAAILEQCSNRKLLRFFKKSWVPDELFFQTLIRNVARHGNIRSHTLTLYRFTNSGTPVVYCNDHHDYLARQNFFFARKISPWADDLRDRLDQLADGVRQPCTLVDDKVGRLTPEYDEHCRLYGHGLYGRQVIGKIRDKARGDLAWNRKPYYVIAGLSFQEIRAFQNHLNGQDDIVCHGQLFHPLHADFLDYVERYAGLSRHDVALRDNNMQNFLFQLLQADADRKVGLLVNPDKQIRAMELLVKDPNARIIVLDGNPVQVFLETTDIERLRDEADSKKHTGILDWQAVISGLFVSNYETYRRKMYVLDRLLEQRKTGVLHLNTASGHADSSLTRLQLDDFFHGRPGSVPAGPGPEAVLHFDTGLEAPGEYACLQDVQESIDRFISDRLAELDELDTAELVSNQLK
jgi:hypothetical protein